MFAGLRNEKSSSDSNDDYAEEEATIHTDDGARARDGCSGVGQRWILLAALNLLLNRYKKTTTAKCCHESRSESNATRFFSMRFNFKGTQIVCQKKVFNMCISYLLLKVISCFPKCLFSSFNKCTYSLIVKIYGLELRFIRFFLSIINSLHPLCLFAVLHISSLYTCFSHILRAVSPTNSKNLITSLCCCRDCFAVIMPVLPSNEEDT